MVRVWKSPPTARDRVAEMQLQPNGGVGGATGRSLYDSSTGRATDGDDRFVVLPYADQPRRHLPQGGLLSRVTVASRYAVALPAHQWSQHSAAIIAAESETAGGSFRDPPALVRHQLPASLQLRDGSVGRGAEILAEDASDAARGEVIDSPQAWPSAPGSPNCAADTAIRCVAGPRRSGMALPSPWAAHRAAYRLGMTIATSTEDMAQLSGHE